MLGAPAAAVMSGNFSPSLSFVQVPLGRKFRSLKIWLTMRAFGLDKVRGLVRRHTQLASDLEALIRKDDRYSTWYMGWSASPPTFAMSHATAVYRQHKPDAVKGLNDPPRPRVQAV